MLSLSFARLTLNQTFYEIPDYKTRAIYYAISKCEGEEIRSAPEQQPISVLPDGIATDTDELNDDDPKDVRCLSFFN